jgi:formylglycine-generating enzyme required for sulfatase activity
MEDPATPQVNTSGGAFIEGSVHISQGDLIGRDKIVNIGLTLEEIIRLYQELRRNEPPSSPSNAHLLEPTIDHAPFEPETILIPDGPFLMGSILSPEEQPPHAVDLPGFRIGKYPVTNRQYAEFLRRTPKQEAPPRAGWFNRRPPKDKLDHPVTGVSWYDACAYCASLSQATETGRVYRLPSEAEWEKAARGADGRLYPWGEAWLEDRCNVSSAGTSTVTQHPDGASPYGCLDMLGNVQEWTNTLWGGDLNQGDFPYPYQYDDGREERETTGLVMRIHRGGSFRSPAAEVRCSARSASHVDSSVTWRGFRVVMAFR